MPVPRPLPHHRQGDLPSAGCGEKSEGINMVANNPIDHGCKIECDCGCTKPATVISYSATATGIICLQEEAALFTLQLGWGLFEGTVPADHSRWLKWPVARWFYRRWRRKHPRVVTVEMTQVAPGVGVWDFSKIGGFEGGAK